MNVIPVVNYLILFRVHLNIKINENNSKNQNQSSPGFFSRISEHFSCVIESQYEGESLE
jgi:hypothetical protein